MLDSVGLLELQRAAYRERSRKWRETHREEWNAYHRQYRAKMREDPLRMEIVRQYNHSRYLAHRDECRRSRN